MASNSLDDRSPIAAFSDVLAKTTAQINKVPTDAWRSLVVVIALFWICRSLASLFWVIFPSPELPQPAVVAQAVKAEVASSSVVVDVGSLRDMHIMGEMSAEIAAPEVEEEPAPKDVEAEVTTKLNLKLQGVIASSVQAHARAIIADGNDQALYKVGEELAKKNGVKLAKVMAQRVILDNNGRYESLWLYSEEDFKKTASASQRRVPKSSGSESRSKYSNNRGRPSSQSKNTINTKARPDQIPKSISDVVRFSVHREDGKMVGYRVRPGRDRELFQQVGLKTNDIVTSVNGISIDDPKQIRTVYKSLKTATDAQLSVLRNGEVFSINISLDTGG